MRCWCFTPGSLSQSAPSARFRAEKGNFPMGSTTKSDAGTTLNELTVDYNRPIHVKPLFSAITFSCPGICIRLHSQAHRPSIIHYGQWRVHIRGILILKKFEILNFACSQVLLLGSLVSELFKIVHSLLRRRHHRY